MDDPEEARIGFTSMRRVIVGSVLLAFCLTGCVVLPIGHHHGKRGLGLKGPCKESQYWDGTTCRHKGKGHGARKHDG